VQHPPADPLVGRTIAHYEVVARLGGGGMGVVYTARDTRLGRRVALKFLPPQWSHDESAKERFVREAQAASATDHPNICTIHDIGTTDDGQLFIVMAHYDGDTLKKRLEGGPLGVDEAIDIAAQIAEGLAKAHAEGVVHRDIKPGNLMLTETGVKILDFGLAKMADSRLTLTLEGSTVGTIAYMSPEQVRGDEADARSDVWGLGAALYEMLAGDVPFKGGYSEAIAHAIKNDAPVPLRTRRPEVAEALEQLVFRALHKDPAVRFQTARDLARALRRLQGRTLPLDLRTEPVVPAMSTPAGRAVWPAAIAPWRMSHPRRRAALAAVILAAALVGTLLVIATPLLEALLRMTRNEPPLPDNKNVAVLPFEVAGRTPEDEAWANGVSAMLSAMLTRLTVPALQVAPFDDVRARALNAASARSDLGATLVVTGSVERVGTTVRVASRVLDTTTSRQLRAATFSVPSTDSIALLDRLLATTLQMLDVEVAESERAALVPRGTSVAAAGGLYLQGRGYLQYYEKWENIEGAIAAFTGALKLDPMYAQAYAGLGEASWRKTRAGRGQSAADAQYDSSEEPQWLEAALANCTRALVLDPGLAAAHVCLGRIHDARGRHEEAVVAFQRALASEPTNDDAYVGLGQAEEQLGRVEQAENTYRRAVLLRPRYWVHYNRLGHFYFNRGRYAEAAEMFAQVVALAPDSFRGYSNLGGAYIHLGRYDEAIAALERSVAIQPTASSTSNLGTAYFNRGRFADAARAFEQAVKLVDTNYELWGNLADAYHWAPGERPRAAGAYRRAISLGLPQLKVNPRNTVLVTKLAHYHAMLGERTEALPLVARALQIAPQDGFVLFRSAVTLNRLGETDRSIDLLEKARAAGFSVTVIRDTPDLSNLWRYPRFQNLLRGQ
jgi:tetratricopeptide (TPR) repeat protein